jgi:hypothetical protein
MKKIIASAIGLVLVGGVAVTTASAVESQFGGYWRTRAFALNNFGQPTDSTTQQYIVDTRTRLYYTAKFNDSFKFVNRFEIDNEWGDNTGGDVGADGHAIFEVKHSYADFTIGKVNSKIGIQGANIARGFLFSADFSGAVITADFGSVSVPFLYAFVSMKMQVVLLYYLALKLRQQLRLLVLMLRVPSTLLAAVMEIYISSLLCHQLRSTIT